MVWISRKFVWAKHLMNVLLTNTCGILEVKVWLSEKYKAAESMGMIWLFWAEQSRFLRLRKMSVGYSFFKNHLEAWIRVYNCSKKDCVGHFYELNNGTFYKRINYLLLPSERASSWGGYFRKVAKHDNYLFHWQGASQPHCTPWGPQSFLSALTNSLYA